MASCLIYDPSTLPTMETVFDGVVTAIDGDKVTFDVKTGWKGVGDRVTLTDPEYRGFARSATSRTSRSAVDTSSPQPASNINACGYTLDYDAKTASEWAAAFGG